MPRPLALGGILGPAAFVSAWAGLGANTDGYDPTVDAISRLAAVGVESRPAMTAGFFTFGIAVPLYAAALRTELAGPAWMAAAATGTASVAVAALPLDGPAGGLPHALAAGVGYATLTATPLLAACPLAALGRRRWAAASVAAGAVSGACLLATLVATRSGLFQRIGLTVGDVWIAASAVAVLRGGFTRDQHLLRGAPGPME